MLHSGKLKPYSLVLVASQNTLAYFGTVSETEKESFIKLSPDWSGSRDEDAETKKQKLVNGSNKLECYVADAGKVCQGQTL